MNDIAPQQAFERAMRLWWLIAACVFLGGVAGWTFSLFHAPAYEATAFYHVSVDSAEVTRRLGRDPQDPLEFSQVRPYLDPVAVAFYQPETQSELLSAAQAQGIPAEAVDLHSPNLSLDRNGSLWYITVRSEDPQLAARAANLWLELVDARVQAMLAHAYKAQSLEAVRSAVLKCLSSMNLVKANECAGTTFRTTVEFESYIGELDRQVAAERQASGGLDTVLDVRLDRQAEPPTEPVLYQQGTLILAGSIVGFLAGLVLTQIRPARSRMAG
jgi:uncharacterized protein involved in exopolysaccharide biosynthesis